MKKFTLLVLFIHLSVTAFNQVIRGTVFEDQTNNPICFATVNINGTFTGTTLGVLSW
jgi:hypothetical protein